MSDAYSPPQDVSNPLQHNRLDAKAAASWTRLHQAPGLIWHTYPLGLLGADQTGVDRTSHGDLRELTEWLPHLISLGADTLLLGPVFASLSHGYDTVTHLEIDDRIGSVADLDALISRAASFGVGIVLDGAFAYASRAFWRLAQPDETAAPWFARDADGGLVPWRVDALVTPDYGSPGYQNYVVDVMCHWLDRGIVGWRLDSSWSVPDTFWRKVLSRVRQPHPAAWLLGQTFDDDLPSIINRATYSSSTEYALMHGTREWLGGGAVDGMVATLHVHANNCTRNPVHTFIGNHDFARLADVVDTELLSAAFAILMTLPGIPAIYYGDEYGLTSRWIEGTSDAALRPRMAATEPALDGPASDLLAIVRRLGAFRRMHPWLTTASLDAISTPGDAITYRCIGGGGETAQVCVNPSTAAVTLEPGPGGRLVLGSGRRVTASTVEVPPRSWVVLLNS